jgi:hypothetical protein
MKNFVLVLACSTSLGLVQASAVALDAWLTLRHAITLVGFDQQQVRLAKLGLSSNLP